VKSVVLRKVAYLLPGTARPVWAFVLAQREALSLLFVERPDDNYSHTLVVATENPAAGVFEDVGANRFPMESEDLWRGDSKLWVQGLPRSSSASCSGWKTETRILP
jgi:hypothetical protein